MCDFLFVIIELFSLALTVEALQGKTCQDSLLLGGGRSVLAKISGEGVVLGEHFLVSTKLDTFCHLTCKLHRATCRRFDTIPACDRRTAGRRQTDRIIVAGTALAVRALRRAVKTQQLWLAIPSQTSTDSNKIQIFTARRNALQALY